MHFFGKERARDPEPLRNAGCLGIFGTGGPRARAAKLLTGLTVATLLGATGLARPVQACSIIDDSVGGPLFGVRWNVDGGIPRNAAFLRKGPQAPGDPVALAYDPTSRMPIMGHVVRLIAQRANKIEFNPQPLFIAKPDELLPLNADIKVSVGATMENITVGDYVDEMPPEMPRITSGAIEQGEAESGCGKEEGSCGSGPWTNLRFTIAELSKDDHAPDTSVTYALYLERSADEARAATTPFILIRGPLLMPDGSLSHFMGLDHSWNETDAFISVSAFDMAGNESPRSQPYQVNAASSGCALSLHRRRSSVSVTALLALAGLAWARRRSGARAYASRRRTLPR